MPRSYKEVEALLQKLEQIMRDSSLWSSKQPSEAALSSKMPFAYDTLSFEQWLQFVFIPKINQLINANEALPVSLSLSPMTQQNPANVLYNELFVATIEQIDQVFSEL